jgi:hypothetical protein
VRGGHNKGKIGPESGCWKGDAAKYHSKHFWIGRHYGKADHCENPDCKGTSKHFQWANISGNYERFISDYKQLCIPCHRRFDTRGSCKYGHPYSGKNLVITKRGYWRCRECALRRTRDWRAKQAEAKSAQALRAIARAKQQGNAA